MELRSSVPPRATATSETASVPSVGVQVAIPRPPRRATATGTSPRSRDSDIGCDPRSPWRTAATNWSACVWLPRTRCGARPPRRATATRGYAARRPGPAGRCDPRPPRRATATPMRGCPYGRHRKLRSSATPEGNRHSGTTASLPLGSRLRPSAAPEGDRHVDRRVTVDHGVVVATLGRPGERPPRRRSACTWGGCDPRSPWRATATPCMAASSPSGAVLRSSAAPEGDRHDPLQLSGPGAGGIAIRSRLEG